MLLQIYDSSKVESPDSNKYLSSETEKKQPSHCHRPYSCRHDGRKDQSSYKNGCQRIGHQSHTPEYFHSTHNLLTDDIQKMVYCQILFYGVLNPDFPRYCL